MSAHATTVQTGPEGAHQIPSNDLSLFYYPPFLSAEYAPVWDPETGKWLANPMGMSGEDLSELLAAPPGGHPSDGNTDGVSQEDEDDWNKTDASEHPSPSDNS